jgi:excisionase family DNA binding protein
VKQVFTTSEVARICKVAPRTVGKWFDSGRLRGYRIPGTQDRRIPRDHLIQFLKEHGMPLGELEDVFQSMSDIEDKHRDVVIAAVTNLGMERAIAEAGEKADAHRIAYVALELLMYGLGNEIKAEEYLLAELNNMASRK